MKIQIQECGDFRRTDFRACGKRAHHFCHSERSEESLFDPSPRKEGEIPRFARNDKINHFFRSLFSLSGFPRVRKIQSPLAEACATSYFSIFASSSTNFCWRSD